MAARRGLRRFAAIVALVVPVAMIVVAAVALAGDVPIAVLAVVLVLVANAAVWFALTERGAPRAFGALVAALATAGLVVVLATHWHGVLVLIGLLLLLALFGLKRFDLAGEARQRGIEPIVLQPGDDLLELAENAIARGAQVIGMAGGDGSQALVATVAARHDVAHVCIPAGTRNHFALDLGLDRDDVVGALDAFTDGVERRIDLACVNDRVFVNNASLGVYAKVVQSEAYRDAKLETWTRMLPDLLGPDAEPIDLQFTAPDGTSCNDAPLVLVSNNPYELTHLSGAGTRERIDPGLLSWSAPELEVRSGAPVEIGLDGEALVLEAPLHFTSMPGALRVRLPRRAGLSPAARAVALTTENLGTLLHVAAGR